MWTMQEALSFSKAGDWPDPASINPSKFIESVFSTYLYDGTGSSQTINNGIDLSKLVEKNKKIKILDSDTTIETKDFSFKVKIPTLDKDIKVNEFLIKNYKDENTIIGKLYVNEVVKFIESITIKETGTIIDFNELPIKKLFEITENIESHNFKKIYEFIQVVRNYEKDLVTLDDVQVDIGPELFVL